MGVIRNRIRGAMLKYKKDRNLLNLLKTISDIADYQVRYQWMREVFDRELANAYRDILRNGNPSHREGKVNDY